eukprot:11251184-Alexandrium_andersonii.AAC.1
MTLRATAAPPRPGRDRRMRKWRTPKQRPRPWPWLATKSRCLTLGAGPASLRSGWTGRRSTLSTSPARRPSA